MMPWAALMLSINEVVMALVPAAARSGPPLILCPSVGKGFDVAAAARRSVGA
jgi:hypothetical protein